MKKARVLIDLVLLSILLIGLFYSSSQPYEKQDIRGTIKQYVDAQSLSETLGDLSFHYGGSEISVQEDGVAGFLEFFIRKGTHFITFASICLFVYRVLRHGFSFATTIPWSGFLAVIIALFDEWHQTFTPNRTGMLTDVLLDTTGICTMLVLLFLWNWYVTVPRRGKSSDKSKQVHPS